MTIKAEPPENDDWEAEKLDRIARIPQSLIRRARRDLFTHTDLLDERQFDETFAEHRLPNIPRRTAEQTVPVTSVFPPYDDPDTSDFFVTCQIADPIDAAILLNAREPDIVLQSLEALIAFVEDRLGQFRQDSHEETTPTDTADNAGKKDLAKGSGTGGRKKVASPSACSFVLLSVCPSTGLSICLSFCSSAC